MSLLPAIGGSAAVGLAPILKLPNLDAGRLIRKALGMDQFGIDQVREIEWRKSYLWNFKFLKTTNSNSPSPGPPKPFQDFFPATQLTETIATLRSESFEVPGGTIIVPRKTGPRKLIVTYYDDEYNTLLHYFRDWFKYIADDGLIAPLANCCRLVAVNKLNSYQEVISTSAYWVFPDGDLMWEGTSTSEASSYQIEFVIASEIQYSEVSQNNNWKAALQAGYSFLANGTGGLYSKILK